MRPKRRIQLDEPVELNLHPNRRRLAAGLEQAGEQSRLAGSKTLNDALEGDELADGGCAGVLGEDDGGEVGAI